MAALNVKINDIEFKNPVMTASGTFGYGEEFADFVDLGQIGGIIVKGTTLHHREGNPYPRMAETPSGTQSGGGSYGAVRRKSRKKRTQALYRDRRSSVPCQTDRSRILWRRNGKHRLYP